MNKLLSSTLISVCVATLTATSAFAQATPDAGSRPGQRMEKHYAERPFSRPTERVEARLAYARTALKISDAQQSQWEAYANFMRKNAQEREQKFKSRQGHERGRAEHQRSNVIERLEKAQSRQAEAVTRINQYLVVVKPLYAALSPEQQKVADVVLNPRSGSRRGHEKGGHRNFGRG
ncbi:MAG: Spy/CpxP family protein refolding chaperone [Burkholderiales bacterium]|nr:Spy/CpxP family protein refolding chaperone [Burkholderiales bacterium]